MATSQQRAEKPRKFLDASLVPLEKALLARADDLTEQASNEFDPFAPVKQMLAGEFRMLAGELHHW